MIEFNIAVVIAAGTVLAMGLIAGLVKNHLWISEPTACLLIGIVIGPAVLNLADFSSLQVDSDFLLLEVARLTLAMAVMGAALRLPSRYEMQHVRGLAIVLGLGLPAMWLTGAVLASLVLGMSVLPSLLVGAILAPTDPVVAGSVVTGKLAGRSLPARLRYNLTAESGANDGLGLLFVMLPLLLITHHPGTAIQDWVFKVFLWEVCGSVVLGLSAGWLTGRVLLWAYRQPYSESHSTLTIGIALALTVLAAVRLIESDGILAVFVAGLMLNRIVTDRETRHEHTQEAIGRFFDLPVFVLIGTMIPWAGWQALGWPGIVFVLAVLLLRRLPWWLVLRPILPSVKTAGDAVFLGWFGPMGVASVYYALLATGETHIETIWPAVSLTVCASVIFHGISSTPLTRLYRTVSGTDQTQARR